MNKWDQFDEAYREAKITMRIVDRHVGSMAQMIAGRLRSSDTSPSALKRLKQELKDFDMRTGTWKDN